MIPATYNLPDAYRGDTYGPIVFYFNDVSGSGINLDGGLGNCQVRDKLTKCVAVSWDSADSTMLISGNQVVFNAVSGQSMMMPPRVYDYDFQINASGVNNTYLRGELTVIENITD